MADPPRLTGFNGTLVLVRHGESTWVAEGRFQGRGDPPLSELGKRQAELVAEQLRGRDEQTPLPIPTGPPRAIWHSPLDRAAATAQIIADQQPTRIELYPTEGLTEIAQGEWEGVPQAEVIARWPQELAAWRRTPATCARARRRATGRRGSAGSARPGRNGCAWRIAANEGRPRSLARMRPVSQPALPRAPSPVTPRRLPLRASGLSRGPCLSHTTACFDSC